ncbi:MAG: hypothetical protein LIP02_00410, partial [Bacteroidales bacterium]|nr:hypothetical protein [Bacteroidales bacterium]
MKFIPTIQSLARRKDNDGIHKFLQELGRDPGIFSASFQGMGSCAEWQQLYFYHSESEAALLLIDTQGAEDELADEEEFGDERPLWFTTNSHRVSPFSQLCTLSRGFKKVMKLAGHQVDHILLVLVSNTHIINYDDMVDTFEEENGTVFYSVPNLAAWSLPVSSSNLSGQKIFSDFLKYHTLYNQLDPRVRPSRPELVGRI